MDSRAPPVHIQLEEHTAPLPTCSGSSRCTRGTLRCGDGGGVGPRGSGTGAVTGGGTAPPPPCPAAPRAAPISCTGPAPTGTPCDVLPSRSWSGPHLSAGASSAAATVCVVTAGCHHCLGACCCCAPACSSRAHSEVPGLPTGRPETSPACGAAELLGACLPCCRLFCVCGWPG